MHPLKSLNTQNNKITKKEKIYFKNFTISLALVGNV